MQIPYRQMLLGFVFILSAVFAVYAQNISLSEDEKTLTIEDAKDSPIYCFGKKVIIKKAAKEVFSFGGDIIIEGRVEGDVAAIGGNIIQKENAFIGGDVIVFGGTYRAEREPPLRNAEKQTVMVAMFEEELRNFAENPVSLFSPHFSWTFVAQRCLLILFWFIISLALTTISPGAVSRAVTRLQLSTLKIFAIGFFGFWVMVFIIIASVSFLPGYLSTIIALMAFISLFLGYVFGRVALQMSIGKIIQKRFFSEAKQSETIALLIGVVVWSVLLSLPYFWVLALMILFSASIGIVLTARANTSWQKTL
jgi:hypothetical protein